VSSESDNQFYDMDNGEDSDDYYMDDEDNYELDELDKSHDTMKKENWRRLFFKILTSFRISKSRIMTGSDSGPFVWEA
jgi:hypothetical protein